MRKGAVDAVLGLTASDDGRALLRGTKVVDGLRRLLGDRSDIAQAAVSALVNLSADSEAMEAIIKAGMISGLMEGLRDPDCSYKKPILMLLTNLSQTPEGCDQLMQKGAAGGALVGLHFRRLVQMYVTSGKGLKAGAEDEFEYAGSIVHNLTQLPEARHILLEPERGILPALMPQLQSKSALRRRAAAGTLRNCCAETDSSAVSYLLSPSVDVVTHLLLPLAGPDRYTSGEREGMNPLLYKHGAHKERERDPLTRRFLLEALALLALTKPGRVHMRPARVYPVVKLFHEWLENGEAEPSLMLGADAAAGSSSSSGAGAEDQDLTDPDDIAGVDAINRLVQQLFRDDEINHTYEVTGRNKPKPEGSASSSAGDDGVSNKQDSSTAAAGDDDDDLGPASLLEKAAAAARARAALAEVEASKKRMWKYATVPLDQAKAKAAEVTHARSGGPSDEELAGLTTQVPDWTEDDPELPPAFQSKLSISGGSASSSSSSEATAAGSKPSESSVADAKPAPTTITANDSGTSTFSAVENAGLGGVD